MGSSVYTRVHAITHSVQVTAARSDINRGTLRSLVRETGYWLCVCLRQHACAQLSQRLSFLPYAPIEPVSALTGA
jgi:hypothetical protein